MASGEVLETTAADRLLSAEQLGEEKFSKFIEENLFSEEPDIFAKLERNKLQTFSSGKKKFVKDCKGKETSVKLNRIFLLGF